MTFPCAKCDYLRPCTSETECVYADVANLENIMREVRRVATAVEVSTTSSDLADMSIRICREHIKRRLGLEAAYFDDLILMLVQRVLDAEAERDMILNQLALRS